MWSRLSRIVQSRGRSARLARLRGVGRQKAKRAVGNFSRSIWRDPLDCRRTIQLLSGREIAMTQDQSILLPNQDPVVGVRPKDWDRENVFEPEFVWRIQQDRRIRSIRITPSGTVLLDHRYLLNTDRGSWAGLSERPLRRRRSLDLGIAPWAHNWASYGDYLLFVVSKLCRIKDALDQSSWANGTLCYPLRRTNWEQQYLSQLGFGEDRLLDTREVRVSTHTVITAKNQSMLWLPSPSALSALRRTFLKEPQPVTGEKRFYISRSHWRRKVRNEDDVRRMAASFGLDVLEDVPPGVDEQIRLFREASLVVSAHGSALTNVVWCAPGTRIIELLSRSYAVRHIAYLSHVLGLDYTYLVSDSPRSHHWTNIGEDVSIDIGSLAKALEAAIAPT
jgi:hypothetical protein